MNTSATLSAGNEQLTIKSSCKKNAPFALYKGDAPDVVFL